MTRFILNHSMATATNVYLMLYPKPALIDALSKKPELFRKIWLALNEIKSEALVGESRVYGGGLHKHKECNGGERVPTPINIYGRKAEYTCPGEKEMRMSFQM